jgi:hypothetical protein
MIQDIYHRECIVNLSNIIKIDTFGDVKFTYKTFLRFTRFKVRADTKRAPAALACVTKNEQFTFQTILRLTLSGMHSLPIKLF